MIFLTCIFSIASIIPLLWLPASFHFELPVVNVQSIYKWKISASRAKTIALDNIDRWPRPDQSSHEIQWTGSTIEIMRR